MDGGSGEEKARSEADFVLATANPHKVRELSRLSRGRIVFASRPEDLGEVDETGNTFEENAYLKARAVMEHTGRPALGEDSGLEVDALGGAPGVHSARYAGPDASDEDNVRRLLSELEKAGALSPTARTARFRTVMVALWPDGRRIVARGTVSGHIAEAPRGEEGFGYDPVFVPDEGDGRTFAEMTGEEKDALSHRARAFEELVELLGRRGAAPGS